MGIYELMPVGSVKSFYGKAIVVVDDSGNETLKSYNTEVLRRDADGTLHRLGMVGQRQLEGTSSPFVVIVKRMG